MSVIYILIRQRALVERNSVSPMGRIRKNSGKPYDRTLANSATNLEYLPLVPMQ